MVNGCTELEKIHFRQGAVKRRDGRKDRSAAGLAGKGHQVLMTAIIRLYMGIPIVSVTPIKMCFEH
jgi:hypothetical protein